MRWNKVRQIYERQSQELARERERESREWDFWKHAKRCDVWEYLGGKFEALANEELTIHQAARTDRKLRAYCNYNLDQTPVERDMALEGRLCMPYRLESGSWILSEGPTEYFKMRFEAVAARAGSKLETPQGMKAVNFWLHSLCVYLRCRDSSALFARSDTGGIITSLCESSALFCSSLERDSLEEMECSGQPKVTYRKPESANPDVAKRRAIVRSNPNATAQELCEIFDRQGVPLSAKWIDAGFRSWCRAYRDANYRSRIDSIISKDRGID